MHTNWSTYPFLPVSLRQPDLEMRQQGATERPVVEETFLENLFLLNKGKMATLYFTFANNSQWNAKAIRGTILTAGRDHILLREENSNKRVMLLMANLDWVEFDGSISYPSPPAYTSMPLPGSPPMPPASGGGALPAPGGGGGGGAGGPQSNGGVPDQPGYPDQPVVPPPITQG